MQVSGPTVMMMAAAVSWMEGSDKDNKAMMKNYPSASTTKICCGRILCCRACGCVYYMCVSVRAWAGGDVRVRALASDGQ